MAQSANMDASELARDIAAGLASATTATERAALVPAELVEAIQQLKTQRDAVILAHYYVAPEVQAVAEKNGRPCVITLYYRNEKEARKLKKGDVIDGNN